MSFYLNPFLELISTLHSFTTTFPCSPRKLSIHSGSTMKANFRGRKWAICFLSGVIFSQTLLSISPLISIKLDIFIIAAGWSLHPFPFSSLSTQPSLLFFLVVLNGSLEKILLVGYSFFIVPYYMNVLWKMVNYCVKRLLGPEVGAEIYMTQNPNTSVIRVLSPLVLSVSQNDFFWKW